MKRRRIRWVRVGRGLGAVATVAGLIGGTAGSGWAATTPAASTWQSQSAPQPTGGQYKSLNRVSCPIKTFCMAVGQTINTTRFIGAPVAETWDGSTWSIVKAVDPNPGDVGGAALEGVSCLSAEDCTAVGSAPGDNGGGVTLAEHWNGSAWSIERSPNPAGLDDTLEAVSCSSATSCMAVGYSETERTEQVRGLAERWNGSDWRLTATPHPRPYGDQLSAVTCPSVGHCVAVGQHVTAQDVGQKVSYVTFTDLVEIWNGHAWRRQPVPSSPAGSGLYGIACGPAGRCVATGQSSPDHHDQGLAMSLVLNGSRWRLQAIPHLAQSTDSYLNDVVCTGTASCTAAGSSQRGSRWTTLAEIWNGTRWRVQPTPKTAGDPQTFLYSVTCLAPRRCVAVGAASPGGRPGRILIDTEGVGL